MSSDDHQKLANRVKRLHASLREAFNKDRENIDEIWEKHCKDKKNLDNYATAMYHLATTIWEKNNPFTRINWCYETCREYFFKGSLQRILQKNKLRLERSGHPTCEHFITAESLNEDYLDKLHLLDVGSCYNPFMSYKEFETLAIDLCPANKNVHYCDFLKLKVEPKSRLLNSKINEIDYLPEGYFHIIVFSLLLEYFPSSRQRWNCCVKAKRLLKVNGLLLIVTPDSKHQNHNAALIKHWTIALEHIGFQRVVYKKLTHIHCMAFRSVNRCCLGLQKDNSCLSSFCWKISSKFPHIEYFEILKKLSFKGKPYEKAVEKAISLSVENCCVFTEPHLFNLLYIPQDFNCGENDVISNESKSKSSPRTEKDDELLKNLFQELPELSSD